MAIKSDNVLFPASTSNNIDFYYASTVNPDGSAADPMSPDKNKFVPIDTRYREYYYIEQSFYITSLYHDDVTVYISNVDILEGTSLSYIYKAVRLSATDGNTTSYFKCADGGGARPVSGVNTVLSSDNAISSGTQDETSFSFTIPKMVDGNCSYVKITFKIWIEGQNESAIVAYASTAFKVHVDFNVLEN